VPPRILLDTPSAKPVLGFAQYAKVMSQIIEGSDPQFSIGIFGGWGSGKTTLMEAVERELGTQSVRVWFNAWRYEKEDHLIVPLLDVLRDELVTWADNKTSGLEYGKTAREKALKAAAAVGKATRALIAGLSVKLKLPVIEVGVDADKAFAEWGRDRGEDDDEAARAPQSPYHASFKALKEALSQFTTGDGPDRQQRIVIFIDDLDRCLPANALQVLESMKLFFDQAGVVFVVGLDQAVIEAAIDWHYRRSDTAAEPAARPPISGSEYLKKLFQVPFALPAVAADQVDEFLTDLLSGSDEHQSLVELIRPHLGYISADSQINPREIKRYINSYIIFRMITPKPKDPADDDVDVSIVLNTISFRTDWQAAYQALQGNRQAFIDAIKRQFKGEENALRDLDPRLGQLPESFYEYLRTKAGPTLTTVEPDRLDQQARALEVSRAPELPRDALVSSIAEMRELAGNLNPGNEVASARILAGLRERFNAVEIALAAPQFSSQGLQTESRKILRDMNDKADTIEFSIERYQDMNPERFHEILQVRSGIFDDLDRLELVWRAI